MEGGIRNDALLSRAHRALLLLYAWAGPLDVAHSAKRVIVVGGGPAGLEAARVASLRGHEVTVLESSDRLGGRMKDAHALPHQADLAHLLGFLVPEVELAGVAIETGLQTRRTAGPTPKNARGLNVKGTGIGFDK